MKPSEAGSCCMPPHNIVTLSLACRSRATGWRDPWMPARNPVPQSMHVPLTQQMFAF